MFFDRREKVIKNKEDVPEILEVTKNWVTVCRKSWIFLLMEEYILLTSFFIDDRGDRKHKAYFRTQI